MMTKFLNGGFILDRLWNGKDPSRLSKVVKNKIIQ